MGLFAFRLACLFGPENHWVGALERFLGQRGDLAREAFHRDLRCHKAPTDLSDRPVGPPVVPGLRWSGQQYRALRRARHLSRSAAAELASALMVSSRLSKDQVDVLEAGGVPRLDRLGSRLDTIYRADGQSFVERVPVDSDASGSQLTVSYPDYWLGPVWLSLAGPEVVQRATVLLLWPPWEKTLVVRPGTAVTFRRSAINQAPLMVRVQPGWRLTAGIGAHPHATDVNGGWESIDDRSAWAIFDQLYEVYLQAFGRSKDQFVHLLKSRLRGDAGYLSED